MNIHMKKKTVMFVIQGEGRGHLTQAITLYEMLEKLGMEVCCMIIGGDEYKKPPDFFTRQIKVPVISVVSPKFHKKGNKSIHLGRTVLFNILKFPAFMRSLRIMHRLVKYHDPDLIINLYEPLVPMYRSIHAYGGKVLSIAHQYVYLHEDFVFPEGNRLQRELLRGYTRFTSLFSDRIMAISMYELPVSNNRKLVVISPLLRKMIFEKIVSHEDFILIYLVNSGYLDEIKCWNHLNPGVKMHCFTDSQVVRDVHRGSWKFSDDLTFHALDDVVFMDMMARCKGVATTAGFESVCEAMYLGKPIMVVPVEGHFEQYCNAMDAGRFETCISHRSFQIDQLTRHISQCNKTEHQFREWVDEGTMTLWSELSSLMHIGTDIFSNEHIREDCIFLRGDRGIVLPN
jgi:uncharacterized protein (TIGR00661 family)